MPISGSAGEVLALRNAGGQRHDTLPFALPRLSILPTGMRMNTPTDESGFEDGTKLFAHVLLVHEHIIRRQQANPPHNPLRSHP
jgi:hypothetical protein